MKSSRRSRRKPFLFSAEMLESRQLLSTVTWTGAANDNKWFTAGNWSTNAVPNTTTDDVVIPAGDVTPIVCQGGVVFPPLTSSIHSLVSARPIDVLGASLTVNGSSAFNGGLIVEGTLTLGPTASATSLTVNSGGAVAGATDLQVSGPFFLSGDLQVTKAEANGGFTAANFVRVFGELDIPAGQQGTITGTTYVLGAGSIVNAGTLTLQGHGARLNGLTNLGTLICNMTSNTSIATYTGSLLSTGVVNVLVGTFDMESPTSQSIADGTINAASGATLKAYNYRFPSTSHLGGTGTFALTSADVQGSYNVTGNTTLGYLSAFTGPVTAVGTLTVNTGALANFMGNDIAPTAVVLAAGTIQGTGNLTISGILGGSSGGTIQMASTAANGGIAISSNALNIVGGTLINAPGHLSTVTSGGGIVLSSGAIFSNPGSIYFDSSVVAASGSGTFNNTGTLSVSSQGFGLYGPLTFYNSGSLTLWGDGSTMTVDTAVTGISSGTFTFHDTSTLSISAKSFSFPAGSVISGTGTNNFTVAGGTTTVATPLNLGASSTITASYPGILTLNSTGNAINNLVMAGGTLTGTGDLTVNGQASGYGTLSLANTVLNGTLASNVGIAFAGTLTIPQNHTISLQSTNNTALNLYPGAVVNNFGTLNLTNFGFSGNVGVVNNSGTVNVSGAYITFAATFINTGVVNVQSGLFQPGANAGATTGSYVISSGATVNFTKTTTFTAASSITGAGAVQFTGGTITVNGAYNVTGGATFSYPAVVVFNTNVQNLGPISNNTISADVDFNGTIPSLGSNLTAVGTINLHGNNLTLTNFTAYGPLSGTGTITVSGLFTCSGSAQFNGLTILANGGANITGYRANNTALTTAAGHTATISGGFTMTGTSVYENDGVLQLGAGGFTFFGDYSSSSTSKLINTGAIQVVAGAGGEVDLGSSYRFQNSGSIEVQSGKLVDGAFDLTLATGFFRVDAGATLLFTQFNKTISIPPAASISGSGTFGTLVGTFLMNGDYSVTGDLIVGGTLNFLNKNLTVGAVTLNGTLAGVGTFVANKLLTINSGTLQVQQFTANGGTLVTSSGIVTLNGTAFLNPAGAVMTIDPGSYPTISLVGPAVLNNAGTLIASSVRTQYLNGATPAINNTGEIDLVAGTTGITTFGNGVPLNSLGVIHVQSGVFTTLGTHFSSGSSLIIDASAQFEADFGAFTIDSGATITGAGTFVASSGVQIAGAVFNGPSLVVNSPAFVNFSTPNAINHVNGLLMNGGVLNLNGVFTVAGGAHFSSGSSLIINASAQFEAASGTFTVDSGATVTGAGTFVASTPVQVAGAPFNGPSLVIDTSGFLNFSTPNAINHVSGLLINGGILNLAQTTLIINYGVAADPMNTIRGYLNNGYNAGLWNGTSTAPAGVITSTAAAGNANHTTAIGYADSADGLVPLPANTIELKYTLYGDTGLTGAVGFTDFMRMTQHYALTSGATWSQGDFNYDGAVNSADFNLLQPNYGQTLPAPAPAMTPIITPPSGSTRPARTVVMPPASVPLSSSAVVPSAASAITNDKHKTELAKSRKKRLR